MDTLQKALNFIAFLSRTVLDSLAWSRKKAMMFKIKQNEIKLLSRTRDSRSPLWPSSIVGVWGPATKLRSLSSGQRKTGDSGSRRVMPRGSLRPLSDLSAGRTQARKGEVQGHETRGLGACVGKVDKRQGKVPVWMASPMKSLMNNDLKSAIKLSLFCQLLPLVIILWEYLRIYSLPWAVCLRLKSFCTQTQKMWAEEEVTTSLPELILCLFLWQSWTFLGTYAHESTREKHMI